MRPSGFAREHQIQRQLRRGGVRFAPARNPLDVTVEALRAGVSLDHLRQRLWWSESYLADPRVQAALAEMAGSHE